MQRSSLRVETVAAARDRRAVKARVGIRLHGLGAPRDDLIAPPPSAAQPERLASFSKELTLK